MNFLINTKKAIETKVDCLILPIFSDHKLRGGAKTINTANNKIISDFQRNKDIQGKIGQCRILPVAGKPYKRLVLVGCGKYDKYSEKIYKKALISALAKLSTTTHKSAISFLGTNDICGNKAGTEYRVTKILAEAWHQISYQYIATKPSNEKKISLNKLYHGTNGKAKSSDMKTGFNHGDAIGKAIKKVRLLADLPSNICTPTHLANEAKKISRRYKTVSVQVLNESQMKKLGMNSLLSVTAGAKEPAKMIIAEYKGARKNEKPIAIVGKGITFDTGGISLKPSNKMDEMKYDMCGAATTIGLIQVVAELGLNLNAVFIIPTCENVPSSTATKPGDIVKSMSGQTIEILNTDAEGRLILADALTYSQRFKPKSIIDMATLTGACVVALGQHHSGLMSNSDHLAKKLLNAGIDSGDATWRLPLTEDYSNQIVSNFADVANISTRGSGAGTITAGCFLQKFVGDFEWAHIDIAGVAWLEGQNKGATGRPVGLVSEFLISESSD